MIGDIGLDIYGLLESQDTSELINIDRKEAKECLLQEMIKLVPLVPNGLGDDTLTVIKTHITGRSGFKYFVRMLFEHTSENKAALTGHIYSNDSYQIPIIDERLEMSESGHQK